MTINAVRLRTEDGVRYLSALNDGANLLVALPVPVSGLGAKETFLFEPPTTWPLASGSDFSMRGSDAAGRPSDRLVRVDHNVLPLSPGGRKNPPLVTYEVGGPNARVLLIDWFPPGYPAYPGSDLEPAERIFTIEKIVGGAVTEPGTQLNNGDRVCLRINSNRGKIFYVRVASADNGAEVFGDGTTAGEAGTVFIAEFLELQPSSTGSCGILTSLVTRTSDGSAIAGAQVSVTVPSDRFIGITAGDGRTPPLQGVTGTCVPSGTAQVIASANRFQTKIVPVAVPSNGPGGASSEVPIQLDCTLVRGRVVDGGGSGIPGVIVVLRDVNRGIILDERGNPFRTATRADGSFEFRCVPHQFIQVWTTADSSQMQHTRVLTPEGWLNVTIVISSTSTCGNLVGRVIDAQTGEPIVGAIVTESGGRQTRTDANGNFRFECVLPSDANNTVFARATGYLEDFRSGFIPSSGDSSVVVIPLNRVSISELRIILDWGTQPADLDLHLSGPDGLGSRFHCFFVSLSPVAFVILDRDDTNSLGPETITISRSPAGTTGVFIAGDYHIWVHNYSGPTFAGSNAGVSIVAADDMGILTQIARYIITNAQGNLNDNLWHIVNLTVDASGGVTRTDIQTLLNGNSNTIL